MKHVVLSAVVLFIAALSAACGGAGGARRPLTIEPEDTSVGAGDVFDVRVYGEADLSGSYRVAQDGSIDFPFIGRVLVAGLETTTIADLLSARLREGRYMVAPQVSVFVRENNSKRISVMGAVARPGTFPVYSGLTVVQAISLAGGFTSIASRDDTVVTRRTPQGLQRFAISVDAVTQGEQDDFPLRPGDIIYVPERVF